MCVYTHFYVFTAVPDMPSPPPLSSFRCSTAGVVARWQQQQLQHVAVCRLNLFKRHTARKRSSQSRSCDRQAARLDMLLLPRLLVTVVCAAAWVAGEGGAGPPSGCSLKPAANPAFGPICAAAKTKAACANVSETCTWVPPMIKPVDTDCMHWVMVTNSSVWPIPIYKPARDGGLLEVGWQQSGPNGGAPVGTQVICASLDGQLGHFDFDGQSAESGNDRCFLKDELTVCDPPFYVATFARANLTWSTFKAGEDAPTNAYQLDGLYLGRNSLEQGGDGSVVPGHVQHNLGKLGAMTYEDFGAHQTSEFQLATCHPPTRLGYVCDNTTKLCVAQNFSGTGSCGLKPGQNPVYKTICAELKTASACVNASETCVWAQQPPPAPDNKTSFPTQQACASKCIAPPPPPLSAAPCIRFGHTIPVANHVDVEISQAGPPAISHTWTDYKFGDFSDWVNVFKP